MWVAPKHQELRPLVVSHGWGSGFSSNFAWDGCRCDATTVSAANTATCNWLPWWLLSCVAVQLAVCQCKVCLATRLDVVLLDATVLSRIT